jgi:phage protein D
MTQSTVSEPTIGVVAPIVKINGTELSPSQAGLLSLLRVSLGLRIPGRAVLEFDDYGYGISAGGSITMGATVTVSVSGATDPLFDGDITGINLDLSKGHPMLSVVADDPSYRLTLGTVVRTFTNQTFSGIASQIAGDYGLSVAADSTDTTYEYLLQSDTDFGFLNEMADRVGYDWWVDSTRKLNFKKPLSDASPAATLNWKNGLKHFAVRMTGLHPGTVTVRGWDPKQKQAVTADSASTSAGTNATLAQTFMTASSASSYSKVVSTFDSPGSTADAQTLANRAVARWRLGSVLADGVCDVIPSLVPGARLQIDDAGPVSGVYDVTEVQHVYHGTGFDTHFVVGDRAPSTLADTLSPDRGPRRSGSTG